MQYSLEKMHEPKAYGERQNGKSVDALVEAIGKLMVSDEEIVPFIVRFRDRVNHLRPMFESLCYEHFKEKPLFKSKFEWGIKGYSSIIRFISEEESYHKLRGLHIEPVYDLD